jgi:hypothetical protein
MTIEMVTLTNDFHNTEARVRCEVSEYDGVLCIRLSATQTNRAWKKLCGIRECRCSDGPCGERGPQYHNGKLLEVVGTYN